MAVSDWFSKLMGSPEKEVPSFRAWGHPYFQQRRIKALAMKGGGWKGGGAIGKYLDQDVLEVHEGGMAKVYITRDRKGVLHAIKEAKDELVLQIEDKIMFELEATRIIGRLSTYHLVPEDIHFDPNRSTFSVVYPFCVGGTLGDRVDAGEIVFEEMLYYFCSLSLEMLSLHESGLLHLFHEACKYSVSGLGSEKRELACGDFRLWYCPTLQSQEKFTSIRNNRRNFGIYGPGTI